MLSELHYHALHFAGSALYYEHALLRMQKVIKGDKSEKNQLFC